MLATETPEWIADCIASVAPDLIVTGSSDVSDFERTTWLVARTKSVRTLAVIDAWMNYRRRTRLTDGRSSLPDAFAVADKAMADGLENEGVKTARVYQVGQPHLQLLRERLAPRRSPRGAARPLLVFFSECIKEAQSRAPSPGYDQFTVGKLLLDALRKTGPTDLHILPHPLENPGNWARLLAQFQQIRGLSVTLGGLNRDEALCTADGIIGMATMALVEGVLIGVPALSLQPGRIRIENAFLESIDKVKVIVQGAEVPVALSAFMETLHQPIFQTPMPVADGAIERFVSAIESELKLQP
jgi:hypothetical protein